MDAQTKREIAELYKKEFSIYQIEKLIEHRYRREAIRMALKRQGISLRGRNARYCAPEQFDGGDAADFAELLGYFYGDGSLCRDGGKDSYQCCIFFSLNEADLVDRVIDITKRLFEFTPKHYKGRHVYTLKFKRSFAKYLYDIGYPLGKKSVLNPALPGNILQTDPMKKSFVRGFFNAEATINKTLCVQQSIRINMPEKVITKLKEENPSYMLNKQECYFIRWGKVKGLLTEEIKARANILLGIIAVLESWNVRSFIYPVRLYIGKNNKTSMHCELQVSPKDLEKIKRLNLLSCEKKVDKLNKVLRR